MIIIAQRAYSIIPVSETRFLILAKLPILSNPREVIHVKISMFTEVYH